MSDCRCTICGCCRHDHGGWGHAWTDERLEYLSCKHCGSQIENKATPSMGAHQPEWWTHVDTGCFICFPGDLPSPGAEPATE